MCATIFDEIERLPLHPSSKVVGSPTRRTNMQIWTKFMALSLAAVLTLATFVAYPQVAFSETPKERYNKAVYEAEMEFTETIVKARAQLDKVLEELDDEEERRNAKKIFDQTVADAKKIRDEKITQAQEEYDKDLSKANQKDLKEARLAYLKALLDAQKTYQKAIADANGDDAKIAKAKAQYNAAIEKAKADYELAKSGRS